MSRLGLGSFILVAFGLSATAGAVDWPAKVPSKSERGRQLYDRHCVACHGERGAGDGPLAADLVAEVPDFSKGLGGLDREELVRSVMRGKGAMPSFEQAFRDIKPYKEPYKAYAEAVLEHMDALPNMRMDEKKKKPTEPEADEADAPVREVPAPPG